MDRCSLCPGTYNCIPADGPLSAKVMLIGERPGQEEEFNARGGYRRFGSLRCFIGKAGDELNLNYLKLAGLSREDIRCTNAVRCGSDHNRKPTAKEIKSCSERFLKEDLETVNPKVVVLMGATACSLVDQDIDLDVDHGIPRWRTIFSWEGWIVPHYHPALGLHSTGKMQPIMEDWERLGHWLKTGVGGWTERDEQLDYRLADGRADVERYFKDHEGAGFYAAIDTESHVGEWWSVQVSTKVGTGLMVRAEDEEGLSYLAAKLRHTPEFYLHNAPADLPLLDRLAVPYEGKYIDTMQLAYHLGNQPQALKSLGFRLFGIRMKSWSDLVRPWSVNALWDWLLRARTVCEEELTVVEERFSEKTGKRLKDKVVESKLTGMIDHLLRHTAGDDSEYDPWEKLDDVDSKFSQLMCFEERLGKVPRMGIGHVPIDEAVKYGCRDADVTLRVAKALEGLRVIAENNWGVQSYDWDK